MDNVTHTLVGALVGEALAHIGPKTIELRERRRLLVPVLAIGSNLPDIDLLYTTLVHGKLDYLLHHRGHTHTLLGALLLTALLIAACEWLWRRRGHGPTRVERTMLSGAAVLGPLLHITMDASNSYGVHPYWPFDDRWRYGDAVFIVEPLFWAAAAPLAFSLQSRWSRGLVAFVLVAGVALGVVTRMVPFVPLAVYGCVVIAMLYLARRWPQRAAIAGVGVWLAVTATFLVAARFASATVASTLARELPQERLLDAMRTPMPMNPVCWEVMLVQAPDDAHFTVRRAVVSIAPHWLAAAACPTRGLTLPISAPLQPVAAPNTPAWRWYGELTMPRAPLQTLFAQRCEAHALLQFARIPWFIREDQGWRIGDLRYDREAQAGFAEIELDPTASRRCPFWGAPWIPPRSDLLAR